MTKTNMYAAAKTWSPFKGCAFACTYCGPSFQAQAKRQMHLCTQCYDYEPHCHPERLTKIPNSEIVFVAANADLAFCPPEFVAKILDAIDRRNTRRPDQTYYLQSKRPECLLPFVDRLPPNAVLVTTLETNRDEGYTTVSKAPPPSVRYAQFKALRHPRKVITVEPAMDFDEDVFASWIIDIAPEYVWLGFNSRPKAVRLAEPSVEKAERLEAQLRGAGIGVRRKSWR